MTHTFASDGPRPEPVVRVRQADLLTWGALALLLMLSFAPSARLEDWLVPVLVWTACVAVGIAAVGLRALHPSTLTHVLADFWVLPVVFAVYMTLNPVIDLFSPDLLDAFLMRGDATLFGGQISVWVDGRVPPPAVDLLMLAYVSYYLWPALQAARLYHAGREEALARFTLLVLLAIFLNQILYVAVPAIGPRFTLAEHFAGPPQGLLFGTALWESLLASPMLRDCFPSGHTALTFLVTWWAWRHDRPFARVLTPVAVLIVAATVLMRFHYFLDVVFAVPFALGVQALASVLSRRLPWAWTWDPSSGLQAVRRV